MFKTLKIKSSAAAILLTCGMLVGLGGAVGIEALLAPSHQARAGEREDEEHYWDRFKEHHAELFQAAHALREARQALESSKREYGGHRDKAIDLIRQANRELHAAADGAKP